MKRLFLTVLAVFSLSAFALSAFAQQNATLSGIIKSEQPLPEGTRVAVHVIDRDGVWGLEVDSVVPVAGTFSVTPGQVSGNQLRPFRSGAVLLPGLQNEYRVTPGDVNFAQGRVNMYVDNNNNALFDRVIDAFFIGVASLEQPEGFFSLLYVDKDAVLSGSGVELQLKAGWNIFTVRFPPGQGPTYTIIDRVDDAVLNVFLE